MKRILFLVLLMVAAPSFAQKDNNTVKLGIFESKGMFEGCRDGEKKSGYCYDYMMQVANYTGWNYEFVYGSFAQLYEKLKNGEIDILPYTNYNAQRGKEVLFSNQKLAEEEYFLAVKETTDLQGGISSLNGKVISTMVDADYNGLLFDFIRQNKLDVKVTYYHYVNEIWDALRTGKADATISTSISYCDDDWSFISSFGKKPTYICVAKHRPDLLTQLNEVTDLIQKESPAFMETLYAKYFSDNPMRKSLTHEEREWVDLHPVLHVGVFNDDAPYLFSYDEDTKTATGMSIDLISGIIDNLDLGISAEFKCFDSLSDMEDALDAGEIDVIIPFYSNFYLAQEHNLIISNAVRMSGMELVYKKGVSFNDALSKVATPTTKLGGFYVDDNFPHSEIVEAVSIQDAVNKVLEGKANGAIAQNVMIHYIKEQYSNLNSIVLPEMCETCFATRPSNYPLIKILNRGLMYYSRGEISALAAHYNPETKITIRAFLAARREVIPMLIILLVALAALIIALVQVNRLKRKANEANRSKTAFLFNMSHDIRTPMNAISGFTTMARKRVGEKDKVIEYLDKIDVSGQQLLTLINQVLEMARIESGKIEFSNKPVNIKERFEAMISVVSEQASERGLEFSPSLVNLQHPFVLADDARMSQITLNIVGNAMKYTPEGGRIGFSLKELPSKKEGYGTYMFTVEDSGIGMSEEFLKDIFEPFTREKNTTVSKIQGTGLGMSIVKDLVDLLGGTIDVQSEPGKGTRFDVTLDFQFDPNAKPVEEEIEPIDSMNKFHTLSAEMLKGKRVLLVEDNELNREIAKFLLEDKGLVVDEAEDGDVAVDKVKLVAEGKADSYDFILMDVQMPRMDGYAATKEIRKIKLPSQPRIPIIALSANAFEEDRRKSREAGMDAHVAKPIDVEELWSTLLQYIK